jgi:hypothetical protein
MGVVTIDNQEWVFAAAYLRARERQDAEQMEQITTAYFEHIEACVQYYRELSARLFRRDIPQVLLLHANQLNADHIDELLARLRAGGAEFVTLEQAVSDPAYQSADSYVGPRGLSWLQRWALSRELPVPEEPREPVWVARAVAN